MTARPAIRVAMVAPPRAVVTSGVAPLRAEPSEASELVDEAHFGEPLTLLGERGAWRYVQGPDLYFGWIELAHLAPLDEPDRSLVAVPLALVRAAPREDAPVVDALPAGAALGGRPAGGWVRAGDGWVREAELVPHASLPRRYPSAEDLLATAEPFLGVPYLWGGTSARGLDCSGFVQQVYRLNGVGLDRDADQQALGGRPAERARAGDLFFFGAESVTHVALATGERTFIHAPQRGAAVEPGALGEDRRLRAVRRYLP